MGRGTFTVINAGGTAAHRDESATAQRRDGDPQLKRRTASGQHPQGQRAIARLQIVTEHPPERATRRASAKARDPSSSEEDIRSVVIAGLVREQWGYPQSKIRTEARTQSRGRADIECTRGDGRKIIIELKRPAVDLSKPQAAADALDQARRYGRELDAERVLVTNGSVWLTGRPSDRNGGDRLVRPDLDKLVKGTTGYRYAERPTPVDGARATLERLRTGKIGCDDAAEELGMEADRVKTTHGVVYPLGIDGSDTRLLIESRDAAGGNGLTAQTLTEYEARTFNGIGKPRTAAARRSFPRHGVIAAGAASTPLKLQVFQDWDGLKTSGFGGSRGTALAQHLDWCAKVASGATTRRERMQRLDRQALGREFYTQIGVWFKRTRQRDSDLRHLMRIVFCRLLASRGLLDHWALTDATKARRAGHRIHDGLLDLFGTGMANPDEATVRGLPYLNGSLFTPYDDSGLPHRLSDDKYRNSDGDGLLDLLDRYEWTLDEPSAFSTECRVDPEMLGSLFESLMSRTSDPGLAQRTGGATTNVQQPLGAYYTPLDVVEAVTAEALADAAAPSADEEKRSTLAEWFRGRTDSGPSGTDWRKRTLNLSVLDPACGSGAFAVSAARMLTGAWRRLGAPGGFAHVISNQITALDIAPMAVQITRLRLYIAAVNENATDGRINVLPNLETRTKCVDTLSTPATGQMRLTNPEYRKALGEYGAALQLWVEASSAQTKRDARSMIESARADAQLEARVANPEDAAGFLEIDPTKDSLEPGTGDLRNMLGEIDGYDLVIGNPPYQKISAIGEQLKKRTERNLRTGGYLKHQNTYEAFLELAVSVTSVDGCIAMIVPNSLCFGKAQRRLRALLMDRFRDSRTRLYDNNPKGVFPKSPWSGTTKPENGQRIAIVHLRNRRGHGPSRAGSEKPHARRATGRISISETTRARLFEALPETCDVSPLLPQWVNAPTRETAILAGKMKPKQDENQQEQAEKTTPLSAPRTARYFVTIVPAGDVPNSRRYTFNPNKWTGRKYVSHAWLTLYNSRVFHAWWLMTGDLFDVTRENLRVAPPAGWVEAGLLKETAEIGRELMNADVILHYNWVAVHSSLKTTPAVAAGLIRHAWSIHWIAELAEMYHETARDVARRTAARRAADEAAG